MLSKRDKKIMILNIIKEKKELLFGKTSNILTKKDKVNEWQNIYFKCLALGLAKEGKDYTYVRDVFWPNVKRTSLVKFYSYNYNYLAVSVNA